MFAKVVILIFLVITLISANEEPTKLINRFVDQVHKTFNKELSNINDFEKKKIDNPTFGMDDVKDLKAEAVEVTDDFQKILTAAKDFIEGIIKGNDEGELKEVKDKILKSTDDVKKSLESKLDGLEKSIKN